jgi:hypothetical protein
MCYYYKNWKDYFWDFTKNQKAFMIQLVFRMSILISYSHLRVRRNDTITSNFLINILCLYD